ncbi:MAG TPA: hypothetical protein VFY13_06270, partial [Luteolibacter sp.]|nr:hypothetical protein [Luteolibacter sp.]
ETPLCFDPHGRIMVTTGQSGGLFFWKLDEVRAGLVQIGLDWEHMPLFVPLTLPKVVRVHLPEGS